MKRLEAAKKGTITWLPPPGLGRPYDPEEEKKKADLEAEVKRKIRAAEAEQKKYGNFDDDGMDMLN